MRDVLTSSGGSLVACLLTPEAVYVSADSRYSDAQFVVSDSAQKLVPYGRTALCALSGQLCFTRTAYDSESKAALACQSFELSMVLKALKPTLESYRESDVVSSFAASLHANLDRIWKVFATDLTEPFGSTARRSSRLASILYANRTLEGATVFSVVISHSVTRLVSGRYCSTLHDPAVHCLHDESVERPTLFLQGMKECVSAGDDILQVHDETAATEAMNKLYERARCTPLCRAAIGGPLDIAVIDKFGRKWLQTKEAPV